MKDITKEHPIGDAWKSTFQAVVEAFRAGDYGLSCGVPMVKPVSSGTARQIEAYIDVYGETLDALPAATWTTSVARWMEGYWDVLVDLWTVESGQSDLVLSVVVYEEGDAYLIEVAGVFVP